MEKRTSCGMKERWWETSTGLQFWMKEAKMSSLVELLEMGRCIFLVGQMRERMVVVL